MRSKILPCIIIVVVLLIFRLSVDSINIDETPSQLDTTSFLNETNTFENYIKLHNSITRTLPHNGRYLVFRSSGGLANHLYGAVSALWIALVTDRAFIGYGPKIADMALFYDTPFNTWHIDDIDSHFDDYATVSISNYYCDTQQKASQVVHNLKIYAEEEVLHLETNCPLFLGMLKDRYYTEPLKKLGVDISSPEAVLGYFLRAFFKLKPHTQKIVDAYKKKWEVYDKVIGIQIRMAGQTAWGKDTTEYMTLDHIPTFWTCAERFVPSKNVLYFISADNQKAIELVSNHFTGKTEVYSGNIIHFEQTKNASFEALQKVYVDNHLLSLCDDLIITASSTFGKVAIARGGKTHWHTVTKVGCTENKIV